MSLNDDNPIEFYECPSRHIYVFQYKLGRFCYLLGEAHISTKKYIVALQKPKRYITQNKSIRKVEFDDCKNSQINEEACK